MKENIIWIGFIIGVVTGIFMGLTIASFGNPVDQYKTCLDSGADEDYCYSLSK